ncbi:MAG: GDSL family lipase [Pirellulales bacterium]|nr:GDSL family lipase [Pirellulales bacterium]
MRCTKFERFWLAIAISLSLFAASAYAKDTPPDTVKPVSKPDPKWNKRHQSMNDRVKKGNVDLLLIGDSITNGWEGRGKEVWKKYYERRNAVNLGIGGDRTQHVLWRLENGNLEGISPKLAVIMIGTNNVGSQRDPRNSPEEIAAGVKAIVEKLRAKLPEMKVLVLAIFPRGTDDKDEKRQSVGKANEIIAKLADGKMVFFLDIGAKFLAPDGTLPKDVMPDLLHPNAKGYQIWAEAMEPTLANLLGDEPVKSGQ